MFLFESVKEYQNSIERALAGYLTGKDDSELSDSDVKAAQTITKKIPILKDYIELHNALDKDNDVGIAEILSKMDLYKKEIKVLDMVEGESIQEGFEHHFQCPSGMVSKVEKYLDDQDVDYVKKGAKFHLKLEDATKAYRIERGLNKVLKRNVNIIRDHIIEQVINKYLINKKFAKELNMSKDKIHENVLGMTKVPGISTPELDRLVHLAGVKKKVSENFDDLGPTNNPATAGPLPGQSNMDSFNDDDFGSDLPVGQETNFDSGFGGDDFAELSDLGDNDFGDEDFDDDDLGMEPSMQPQPPNSYSLPQAMPTSPAPLSDVRSEIENSLNDIIAKAPDLKISDFKDIVARAEDNLHQLKMMGNQYLKESLRMQNRGKTIRQIHEGMSAFKKNYLSLQGNVKGKK